MRIGEREIGAGRPVYVIAEIGVNHDGQMDRALGLVDAAAAAGADAVKVQYFEADRLMSRAAKLAAYQRAAGEGDPLEMLRRLELGLDEMGLVVERAHGLGMHAIVTVFSVEHVGPVSGLGFDAFKSASPDVINRPLLEATAGTGGALIVSTGASTLEEVERAAGWLGEFGAAERSAVLHCVSCYPTRYEDAALGGIAALGRVWSGAVGYSDHAEIGGWMPVRAGAQILEKHLTWNRRASGPDHAASLEAEEFGRYVEEARWVGTEGFERFFEREGWSEGRDDPAVGMIEKRVLECEREVREVSRQSLVWSRPLARGDPIARDDVTIKRPGRGIPPFRLCEVVGRRVARAVEADMPMTDGDVEWAHER